MKRYLSLFLCLLMAFSLCACISDIKNVEMPPMPTSTPEPVATAEVIITPAPEATINTRILVYTEHENSKHYDPMNGTIEILDFKCATPRVFIDGNQEASDKINAFLRDKEKFNYYSTEEVGTVLDKRNEILSNAEEYFNLYIEEANDYVIDFGFDFERKFEVLRADDSVIGFKFTDRTWQFNNETIEESEFYFDTSTGEEIDRYVVSEEDYAAADKNGTGALSVVDLSGADSSKYEIIDMIDSGAEEAMDYLISSEGIVYDVIIGDSWYCNILNNQAVQLRTVVPEALADAIVVSYFSDDKVNNFMFMKDSGNGTAGLVDFASVTPEG